MAAYRKAIDLAPGRPRYYRLLFRANRATPGGQYTLGLTSLLGQADSLAPQGQAELHFGLGQMFEQLGEYPQAFEHFRQGATIKRALLTYDEAGTLARLERTKTIFDEAFMLRRCRGDRSSNPVFIVGMPRSGSTLIEQVLAKHPKVFAAGELPTHDLLPDGVDFPDDLPTWQLPARNSRFSELGTAYVSKVRALAPYAARMTNKLPANFRLVGLIHLAMPHATIIHTVRNPVDTCWSCFSNLFTTNQAQTYDLGELGRYYRAYASLMEHWRTVLPKGVMLDVRYEDMVTDFENQARRIVDFIGLPWDESCLRFYESERRVKTASVSQVRRPIYQTSIGYATKYGALLDPLGL